ncbi:MAG: putative DNA binding domain-containing protein [Treponema sp.]|nr:putative DNA binding domain-containing protein [Treponema sp.]
MTLFESIQMGESKTLEFKRQIPLDDKKYLKTVVAFANGSGGRIVFGVDDETREITGVDPDKLFIYMDSIANAVSEVCTPSIVPDIVFQTVGNKTVIVVEIHPGQNKPYFIKKEGVTDGTYIRVGATTRKAEYEKIQEYILFGRHQYYDEMPFSEIPVEMNRVDSLCTAIAEYTKKTVSKENLTGWGILIKQENDYIPSNAFELLTENTFTFAKIQCGRFKGTDKTVFIDKRDIEGPVYKQIDEAYKFVLEHINLGAHIEGILRIEQYELPPEAIREVIVNAVVHRNYLAHSFIQVSVYDDRVEVTSPGTLYGGITIEDMKNGSSSIRNRVLADVFGKMHLAEHWGTGMLKVFRLCSEYALKEPLIEERSESLVVTLWRKSGDKVATSGDKVATSSDENTRKILGYLKSNSFITSGIAQQLTSLSPSGVRKILVKLVKQNVLTTLGDNKNRTYQLKREED